MKRPGFEIFAVASPGLEQILHDELVSLGIESAEIVSGGVEFAGGWDVLWRANLCSRIASRIVVRVDEFHASSFHELERRAKRVQWSRFIRAGQPVAFRVTCRKSKLYHSDAVAQRLAEAVGKAGGGIATVAEPDDDESDETSQLFIVRISHDVCTISADSSGALLHRRGYRQAIGKAPIRETLAASMLIASGWNSRSPLVDPMCGSGTIAIEGAMIARRMAPGLGRTFAFESWPRHDRARWSETVESIKSKCIDRAPASVLASDRDAGAVEAARANAERAGVAGDIEITEKPLSAVQYPDSPGWIVTNPPYGLRVGESAPLRNLYAQFGKTLKARAPGYNLAVLSADRALDAQLRVNLKEIFRTTNGGIPVRLIAGKV